MECLRCREYPASLVVPFSVPVSNLKSFPVLAVDFTPTGVALAIAASAAVSTFLITSQ
jgi:hypothetical protein